MIQPINKRVLIQVIVNEPTSISGIEIVKTSKTSKSSTTITGTVIATSVDTIPVGSTVIFNEGWGNEIEPGLFLVSEDEVKALIV